MVLGCEAVSDLQAVVAVVDEEVLQESQLHLTTLGMYQPYTRREVSLSLV